MKKYSHPYHLVGNSPWPFIVSIVLFNIFGSLIMTIYNKIGGSQILIWSLITLSYAVFNWIKEIINEGTYIGYHTSIVKNNLMFGFILFVISEICIFIGLFFGFFYNSFVPSIDLGNEWPPIGISILNPYSIPLLNTALLFFSGITITISLNYLHTRNKLNSILFILWTILLGSIFTYYQYVEYSTSSFTLIDSFYGSNFYILTGFHGIHVIIGTILLIISFIRILNNHFLTNHHVGFSSSSIYWHFVDYVWLILYTFLYCWAS